jgi:hypothetical protein
LPWVLKYDLQDVNRVVSLAARFPLLTKRILSMLFGVGFQGHPD